MRRRRRSPRPPRGPSSPTTPPGTGPRRPGTTDRAATPATTVPDASALARMSRSAARWITTNKARRARDDPPGDGRRSQPPSRQRDRPAGHPATSRPHPVTEPEGIQRRQGVGPDADPRARTGVGAFLDHGDGMAAPLQGPGRRQARDAGTDDDDPAITRRYRRVMATGGIHDRYVRLVHRLRPRPPSRRRPDPCLDRRPRRRPAPGAAARLPAEPCDVAAGGAAAGSHTSGWCCPTCAATATPASRPGILHTSPTPSGRWPAISLT